MKETIIGIEKAYKDKVYKVYFPQKYFQMELRKERKKRGVCAICGRTKLTPYQKKYRQTSCIKCRKKKRDKQKEWRDEH